MEHEAEHSHGSRAGRAFAAGVVLNLAFVLVEVVFGRPRASRRIAQSNASEMRGLFAYSPYRNEAPRTWRIFDNVLSLPDQPLEYEPGTWGPEAAIRSLVPGGWLQASGPVGRRQRIRNAGFLTHTVRNSRSVAAFHHDRKGLSSVLSGALALRARGARLPTAHFAELTSRPVRWRRGACHVRTHSRHHRTLSRLSVLPAGCHVLADSFDVPRRVCRDVQTRPVGQWCRRRGGRRYRARGCATAWRHR